jgi:hypothetical protein
MNGMNGKGSLCCTARLNFGNHFGFHDQRRLTAQRLASGSRLLASGTGDEPLPATRLAGNVAGAGIPEFPPPADGLQRASAGGRNSTCGWVIAASIGVALGIASFVAWPSGVIWAMASQQTERQY